MTVFNIYLTSILLGNYTFFSNSLFEKLSTHLSMLEALNHNFIKHTQPQNKKPRAYKKKCMPKPDRGTISVFFF